MVFFCAVEFRIQICFFTVFGSTGDILLEIIYSERVVCAIGQVSQICIFKILGSDGRSVTPFDVVLQIERVHETVFGNIIVFRQHRNDAAVDISLEHCAVQM